MVGRRAKAWCGSVRALLLLTAAVLAACAPVHQSVHPRLREQLAGVRSVGLLPPDVRLFRHRLTGGELVADWTDTAHAFVATAVTKRFGAVDRFAVSFVDLGQSAAARDEFERVRRGFARTVELKAEGLLRGPFSCLSAPAPELGEAAKTDTLLLVYAFDRRKTGGLRAAEAIAVGGAAALAVGAAAVSGPGMLPPIVGGDTPGVFAMCLADSRTGATLWFDMGGVGSSDLRDAGSVEALVGQFHTRFTNLVSP
jgi:hypothetical protein